MVKNINQNLSEGLKKTIDSLTSKTKTDEEKVKNIYYWVQKNIKYVAFEDGLGGFVPREANDIFEKKYGDCKDMASIITAMLNHAKLPGYLTWIGSRDIPYTYDEMPSPNCDNHMIAATEINKKLYFLDATSSFTPLGLPTSFIQGKEAMVRKSNTAYEIIKVPVVEAAKNNFNESLDITFNNTILKGNGLFEVTGLLKVNFVWKFIGKEGEELQNTVKSYLQKGNNKFILNDFKIKNLNEKDSTLK